MIHLPELLVVISGFALAGLYLFVINRILKAADPEH